MSPQYVVGQEIVFEIMLCMACALPSATLKDDSCKQEAEAQILFLSISVLFPQGYRTQPWAVQWHMLAASAFVSNPLPQDGEEALPIFFRNALVSSSLNVRPQ